MESKSRIIAFLCNWYSKPGADLAGTSRMENKANVRAIKIKLSVYWTAGCPSSAIKGRHFTDRQISAQIEGLLV